jgi:hypothetical protein
MESHKIRHTEIHHRMAQHFGGHWMYLKLYYQAFKQIKKLPRGTRAKPAWVLIFASPWYLILKPFGKIFSYTVFRNGNHEKLNGKIVKHNIKKRVRLELFRIPFFMLPMRINAKDIEQMEK